MDDARIRASSGYWRFIEDGEHGRYNRGSNAYCAKKAPPGKRGQSQGVPIMRELKSFDDPPRAIPTGLREISSGAETDSLEFESSTRLTVPVPPRAAWRE